MGQERLQKGSCGDAGGESSSAEHPKLLGFGANSEPNSSLAAPHHCYRLLRAAVQWHQCCELRSKMQIALIYSAYRQPFYCEQN